jgi:hypothetical protein
MAGMGNGERDNANPFPKQLERLGCDDALERAIARRPELAWSCDRDGHTPVLEVDGQPFRRECALCGLIVSVEP